MNLLLGDLRASAVNLVTFLILWRFIFASLSIPLVAFLLRSLINIPGIGRSANLGILQFTESFPGIVVVMIVIFFWLTGFSIEQSGLLLIASGRIKGHIPRMRDLLLRVVRTLPRIIGISSFLGGIYTFCSVPILTIFMFQLRRLSNSSFSGNYPSFSTGILGWLLAALSTVVLIRLLLSWLFAMHFAMIGRKPFAQALRESKKLISGNRIKVAAFLVRFWLVAVLVLIAISSAFQIARTSIINTSYEPTSFNILRLSLFASAETIIMSALSILVSSMYSILTTRLFCDLRLRRPELLQEESSDNMKVSALQKRPWLIILFILFAAQSTFFDFFGRLAVESEIDLPLVTAHRGSSIKAPENSMSAVILAVEDGADIIEIDVQITRDGFVVLNHDRTLSKVAGVGKSVAELTLEEIKELEIGSRFSRRFIGEKIPTLEEVIYYMRQVDPNIRLNIELKDYGRSPGIEEAVIRILEDFEFKDRVLITSTSRSQLSKVRSLSPEIPIGLIVTYMSRDIWTIDVDLYSISSTIISESFINRARSMGREIHVWTVNDLESMTRFASLGVNSIITDRPDALSTLLIRKADLSIFQRRVLGILSL